MRNPLPISTLAEAALWLTDATGAAWTDKEVLGAIFQKMIPITIDQEPFENYLHISLPESARLSFRWYDPKTATIKSRLCEGWEMPTLSGYEDAISLFTWGTINLPYPLISDQWEGEDGFCVGADTPPTITIESLRINGGDLAVLGANLKVTEDNVTPPVKTWTKEQNLALLSVHDELEKAKHPSPTKALAEQHGVSETTIRNHLTKARKIKPPVATPYDSLWPK